MSERGELIKDVTGALHESLKQWPLLIINLMALGMMAYVLYAIEIRGEARDALITKLVTSCIERKT